LWEIERYYPTASSVEAATAPSRWALYATCGERVVKWQKDSRLIIKTKRKYYDKNYI
jgi:hypothetical protein